MTSLPPISEDYGYSCNVWFALEMTGQLFPNTRKVWFSTAFNPLDNVDSSNPAEVYVAASRAVQESDIGSRIIKNYRSQLVDLVDREERSGHVSTSAANAYRQQILSEPIESFRPVVWRLDLKKISRRKYNGVENVSQLKRDCQQDAQAEVNHNPPQVLQPNEYLIWDLQVGEYEIIVEG